MGHDAMCQSENENENEKRSELRNDQDASVIRRDWRNTRAAVSASIRMKAAASATAHRQTAVSVMLCSYIFACVDEHVDCEVTCRLRCSP